MRRLISFILVLVFLASQYARQAAWLECRISNYFSTTSIRCDCEKLLAAAPANTPPAPVPVHHNHLHIDEHFIAGNHTTGIDEFIVSSTHCPLVYQSALSPGITNAIDRPPLI
jgi:hypothetical protein